MLKYSKLIVAVAVPLIGWLAKQAGIEIGSEQISEAVIWILTAAGVYAVPNKG